MPLLPRSMGPPFTWPAPLDAALDLWASASGRIRTLVRVVALVLVVLTATGGLLRGPWGPPVEVVTARASIAAGAPLHATELQVTRWPASLVPPDALRSLDELPPDAVMAGLISADGVLTWSQLVLGGPGGAATPGTAVVPFPVDLVPALPVGARVDVAVGTLEGDAVIVARDAVLVADDGTSRWIRVVRDEVVAVAAGISRGALVIAVLPPRPDDGP